MIIIFEGMDRVGKTTLMNKITQLTDYKFPMMDRGPAGFATYDILFDRVTEDRRLSQIKDAESLNQMDVLYVYLYAHETEILKRLKEEGKPLKHDNDRELLADIRETLGMYDTMVDTVYHPGKVLRLNTTSTPVEELVMSVLNEVKRREQFWPLDMTMVGTEVKTGIDVFYPSHNVIPEEVLLALDDFDIEVDEPYYTMLLCQLDHAMHKYREGLVNERNIFITSHDCICFAQIILTDPTRFVINVNQRSFNAEKHGCNDLAVFYYWFQISDMLEGYKNRKLVINYDIGCPHIIPVKEEK